MHERIQRIHHALVQRREDDGGFTLVELLIVIVVLGILAAVTVFGLAGSSSQSAVAACKSDARTVEVAVDAFHAADLQSKWPAPGTFNDLLTPTGAPSQPTGVQPYLRSAPTNTNHYTIDLHAGGVVWVTPTAKPGAADNFDTGNGAVCDNVS